MRRLMILFTVVLSLVIANPVSAATTGKWDLNAGQASVRMTVQQMVKQNREHGEWPEVFVYSEILKQLLSAMGK